MACKHDNRTAYVQGKRPERGFKPVGDLCIKCWRFTARGIKEAKE